MDNKKKDELPEKLRREFVRISLEAFQGKMMDDVRQKSEEELKVPENVEEFLNIPYINRSEVPLAMDIFKPKVKEGTELPVIVYVHGGGLVMGDRKMYRVYARQLAKRGYLVFSLEYRLAPRANVCEQLDDVCAGMDLVGRKLTEFDVDFGRIFLNAESAGAYLAIYVAAMKKSKKLQEAIGYEPTRMAFKALCLYSGMFYTQKKDPVGMILADQVFGEKLFDENFLQYMDPENPEILNNLPPTYLVTSQGDFLNNYTIEYHEALKRAHKDTKLVYYGSKDLAHAFPSLNPLKKESLEVIDKMLSWMEGAANRDKEKMKKMEKDNAKASALEERIKSGEIINQKAWSFIKELNNTEERLSQTAIIAGDREYTYRQMFRMWERYAEVFSALGINQKNKSRAGLFLGSMAESFFAVYGLNMTGAMASCLPCTDILLGKSWIDSLKSEGITDVILSSILATPQNLTAILSKKEELGLKNIIVLPSKFVGFFNEPMIEMFNQMNLKGIRKMPGILFMDELLVKYEAYPITYGKMKADETAIVCHTSGTTKGVHKPIPFTDAAFNDATTHFLQSEELKPKRENSHCLHTMTDMSGVYGTSNMMHMPFAFGCVVIPTYFTQFNEKMQAKAVGHFKVNMLFVSSAVLDHLIVGPQVKYDFSSLDFVALGGMYVSAAQHKKYNDYLKAQGSKVSAINGYGLSETCGAVILSPADREDDTIGYPLPGVTVRIKDDDGKFYSIADGERSGDLYISAKSISCGKIGDTVYFEPVMIDGVPFIDTFDAVKVNEDKSLTYIGRANRFFVNNEGIRFDAGLVETAVSKQPDIDGCAFIPVYSKGTHDTMPVLCIKVTKNSGLPVEVVRNTLKTVFITNNMAKESNLPSNCIICEELPYNAHGKIDVYKITKGEVTGQNFLVKPIRKDEKLVDVLLLPVPEDLKGFMFGAPEELENEPNIFEMLDKKNMKSNKPQGAPFMNMGNGENKPNFGFPPFNFFNQGNNNNGDENKQQGFNGFPFGFPPFNFFNQNQNGEQKQGFNGFPFMNMFNGDNKPNFGFPPFGNNNGENQQNGFNGFPFMNMFNGDNKPNFGFPPFGNNNGENQQNGFSGFPFMNMFNGNKPQGFPFPFMNMNQNNENKEEEKKEGEEKQESKESQKNNFHGCPFMNMFNGENKPNFGFPPFGNFNQNGEQKQNFNGFPFPPFMNMNNGENKPNFGFPPFGNFNQNGEQKQNFNGFPFPPFMNMNNGENKPNFGFPPFGNFNQNGEQKQNFNGFPFPPFMNMNNGENKPNFGFPPFGNFNQNQNGEQKQNFNGFPFPPFMNMNNGENKPNFGFPPFMNMNKDENNQQSGPDMEKMMNNPLFKSLKELFGMMFQQSHTSYNYED